MSPSGVDFDFRKLIDLDGHIFLMHFYEKNHKKYKKIDKTHWICPMDLKFHMQHILYILHITQADICLLTA